MQQFHENLRVELEDRLRFETLLADLSARFVNRPADLIDDEIEAAQRRICELLDLDRSTLWQIREGEPETMLLIHFYQPPGSQPPFRMMNSLEFFPWMEQKVQDKETIIFSKITDLPSEAHRDRESFSTFGTKSGVYIPLSVGEGPVFGLLTFAVMREERSWPETVVRGFKLIAQVFANALARKRADQSLRESEEVNRITFDQEVMGIAHVGIDGRWLKVNDKFCDIVGYPREELLQMTFQDITHPDDLETDLEYLRQVLSGETKPYYREKRYFRKDRSLVWINLNVSLVPSAAGEPQHFVSFAEDITERKRADQALNERLQFEQLLSDFSSRFVNIPPDRVDSEIEDALKQTLEFFRVERCCLMQILRSQTVFQITHRASFNVPALSKGVEQSRSLYPWAYKKLVENKVMSVSSLDDLPAEAEADRQTCIKMNIRSYVNIPILTGESVKYFVHISSVIGERIWPEELFPRLRLLGEIFVNALEMKELKQRLERENVSLREEVQNLSDYSEIVGQSPVMKSVMAQARQVAGTDATVLIQGETGTGKELLARAIHRMSGRGHRPLVTVNCVSLPPGLIDCELFGRERGAYTGALSKMIGRFEIADGSTLFLDEIGEIPIESQSKLLRVLQEGTFERLGSTKIFRTNVRIIAASNRNLEQAVKEGKFRNDLFYRLNVFPIVIPPLRERPEDIPLLVLSIVEEFQKKIGKRIKSVPSQDMEALKAYSWPGNVRELRNVIERAIINTNSPKLHIPINSTSRTDSPGKNDLREIERSHILSVLEKTNWRIMGKAGAAEILGLKRTTLQGKMKKLGIIQQKDLPK
jgi:formate hydrogenlyase transcriptional activator